MRNCTIKWMENRPLGETDSTPKYFVYEYADPMTGDVFYVGKGNRRRHTIHLRQVKRGELPNDNNGKLFRCIKALLDKGTEPMIVKVNDQMPEIEALALEAALIDFYGLENLCNYQQSGIGAVKHTEETKARCRRASLIQHATHNGGFSNYFESIWKRDVGKPRLKVIKARLKLLETIIKDIQKELKAQEQFKAQLLKWQRGCFGRRLNKVKRFKRNCPKCGAECWYSHSTSYHKFNKRKALCGSCSATERWART